MTAAGGREISIEDCSRRLLFGRVLIGHLRFMSYGIRCASLTIMAGAPLMVVAQNLGHQDTRMVELHYGHLADSFVRQVIRETAPSFGLVDDRNVIPIR